MLKLLDRYIIQKYLGTFFFTVLIFSLIAIVIDFSDKVEKFIEEPTTAHEIIFKYYLPYIPYINGLLWPLYALIAVIFFTSRLAYNSEIIAILNAGVSFRRLLVPYLCAGGFVAGLQLLGNHLIIPLGNQSRLGFEHKYIDKDSDKGRVRDIHLFLTPGSKAYIRFYNKRDTSALDLRLEQFENHQLVSLIKASSAKWLGPPNRWRLSDYEWRTFDGREETFKMGRGAHIDTTLNLYPSDFVRYHNQMEMMATPELLRFINDQQTRGAGNTKPYEIEAYRRTTDPVTVLILTIIGVAVAARKVRGGMGLHLAVGIGLGAIFIFLSRFSMTLATNEAISPLLGVWIPNIIFSVVALLLALRAQQ